MPTPDYEDDLVFPPKDWTHLKCNHFVELTEKVKKQDEEVDRLQAKLNIAVRALKKIEILIALNLVDKAKISTAYKLSHEALLKIKELDE